MNDMSARKVSGTNRVRELLRVTAIVVLAYLASANAWWHYRTPYFLGPNTLFNAAFRHLGWLAHGTYFLWLPGWIVVELILGDRQATPLSDFLVPLLSGLFWGGIPVSLFFWLRAVLKGRQ
jgi:hypothetical protein